MNVSLLDSVRLSIRRLAVRAMLRAENVVLDAMRFLLFRKTDDSAKRIIVFRAGALGDFIVALPALRLLRKHYPQAKITLLTVTSLHPRWNNQNIVSGGLALGRHLVDETLFIPGLNRRHWKQLRHLHNRILQFAPDLCVVLPFVGEPLTGRITKLILLRLLGCRKNLYGYHARSNVSCFRKTQHELNMFEHQVTAPIAALKELGIDCDEVAFEIITPDDDMEKVDSWWWQHGLNDESQLCIAMSPFAKQKLKCWPMENFKSLGYSLLSKLPNARLIIVGGPEDGPAGELLEKAWPGQCISFAGRASILQSAEIIRRCKLFIGNDSGPSHIAAAVGVPVVTIFSSFVFPELWRPWGGKSRIVRHSVPCEFCFTENGRCPEGTNACVDNISVNEVLSHCLDAIDDQLPVHSTPYARLT